MMISWKFKKERISELLEYIKLRMRKLKREFPDLISNDEAIKWSDGDHVGDILAPKLHYIVYRGDDSDIVAIYPSEEFWKNSKRLLPSPVAFDVAKWCLDALEAWVRQLYAQAKKEEEELMEKFYGSDVYMQYKSMKVVKKLEEGGENE